MAGHAGAEAGGRVWIVDTAGGRATPLTGETVQALAPAFTPDGRRIAYFAADSNGRAQVWVQEISGGDTVTGSPTRVTDQRDVTPTRVRWAPDGTLVDRRP